jgi:AraC-like DNA-binding protein
MHLVSHAADRWAQSVIRVIDCPFDPKTVALWAQAVGVSEGALRDRCRAAGCRPKQSLDFARLLRAVVQSQERGWDPFNLLDIVNERTMKNLMKRGGVADLLAPNTALTPRGFLFKQHFVTDVTAIAAVAASVQRLCAS